MLFAQPGAIDVQAIAAVRDWVPDGALEAAWATGCNPGGSYGAGIIGPIDPDNLGQVVPWFELITGPAATAVVARITSPAGIAAVEEFRAALHGHGDGCDECGRPLNASPN